MEFAGEPTLPVHDTAPTPGKVPGGLTLLDPRDNAAQEAAAKVPPRQDQYLVFAHGTPDGVVVDGKLVTAPQLASLVHNDPDSKGKRIVLVSCDTGRDPDGFPADLAREVDNLRRDDPGYNGDTSVTAPSDTAFVTPSGKVITAAVTVGDQHAVPGQWTTVSAKGIDTAPETETADDLELAVAFPSQVPPFAGAGRITTNYAVRAGKGPPFTRTIPEPEIVDRGPDVVPRFVVRRPTIADQHPPIRVSPDGTIAINAEPDGRKNEFYTTPERLDGLNQQLRAANSAVTLTATPENTVTVGGETLVMVQPRFDRAMPSVCRDFAANVLGGDPSHVVLRPDGQKARAIPVVANDGMEVTGVFHLAEALAGDKSPQTTGQARDVMAQDQRNHGRMDGAPRPGRDYGLAVNQKPGTVDASKAIGVNQFARARVGEGYLTQSISDRGPGRDAAFDIDHSRTGTPETRKGAYGYHFAGVVAESADTQMHVTLENSRPNSKVEDLATEALRRNVEQFVADPSKTDDRYRAEFEKLAPKLSDPDAFAQSATIARLQLLNDSPEVINNENLWHFRAWGSTPEQSHFAAQQQSPSFVNPMTLVVVGGHAARTASVDFAPGEQNVDPETPAMRSFVQTAAKVAAWRDAQGLGPPAISVESGANGRGLVRLLPDSMPNTHATEMAQQRADSVRAALKHQLDQQGGPAKDIPIQTGTRGRRPAPGAGPKEHRRRRTLVDLDMSPSGSRSTETRNTAHRDGETRNFGQRDTETRNSGQREPETRNSDQQDAETRSIDQRDTGTRSIDQRDGGTRNSGQRDAGTRNFSQQDGGTRSFDQQDTDTRNTGQQDAETRNIGQRGGELRSDAHSEVHARGTESADGGDGRRARTIDGPWAAFGADGRTGSEIRSALDNGFRRFDLADSYRNTDTVADVLSGPGAPPRDGLEIVYKFDVRENESADQLTERLTSVADQFGGRLDSVLVHNIDGGSRDATRRAWDVLANLQSDGRIDRIGLGNVRDEHVDQLNELNERSPVGILENSLDSLLRDTGVQDFVASRRGDSSPEVYYYGVRRLASSMGLDGPADLRGLASAVSTFYGDAPTRMIVSSGDPGRQAAARDDFALAPEHPDHDGVDQFDAQVKVFNWRQRPTFATTNGPDVELDPPLRQWLNDAVTDSANVRAKITADANAQNRAVDADFIAHWLTDRGVIADPDTLDDVRIPERYGLRSQHVDRPLGSVLRDLLGNTSCDWKAAIELTQLTLTPVDDWNNLYPHFGEIVTTQAGTGSDIASDAGSRTSSWATNEVPAEVHDVPPAPRDVPAGITLLDDSETLNNEAARSFAPRDGQFLVFAHGTPKGLVVGGKLVTAPQLARMLQDHPGAQGKQIVLVSCDTGSDPNGFPAELARQDGISSVTAPDRTAFVTPSGRVLTTDATTFGPDGRPRPDLTSPGHWNTFTGTTAEPAESGPDLPTAETVRELVSRIADVESRTPDPAGATTTDPPGPAADPPDARNDFEQAVDFGPKKVTKKELLEQIDGAAKQFTKSYGGGQSGRAVDQFRLRFSRDKRAERAAQTLSHLSFQLHDTFRALRDASPNRSSLPKDLEVQGMLINNRLVFATNFNATVDLLDGVRIPRGDGPPLQRLLSIDQSDDRRRAHLAQQDADEYVGRMDRSRTKLNAAFDGARDSATARAMRANQSIRIADAAPASATERANLRDLLTDPRHEGSAIMLRLDDAGDGSVHAEQKLMLAVHSAGLDPDDIHGTHLVMGKYRPCLGCWAALNAYASEGFPVNFNDNHGNYYTESVRSIIDYLPRLAGSVAQNVRGAADRLMSVSALSRQSPPADAVDNNGRETVIPAHDAPNRGYVTPSDSETEYFDKQRRYVTTKRNLDFATSSRTRTLGVGREKPFAPRAAQRVLTDAERADLAAAWKTRNSAQATALFKHHAARGVSNQEMSEASGASAGHVGRLVNDKDGHEKRDGREKVHRRVQSRSGRSEAGSSTSKFTKRPDLDKAGEKAIRDAMDGTKFKSAWKEIEKQLLFKGTLRAGQLPETLNQELAGLRHRHNMQSIADYLHIPRKSLQQHLDKRYGSVNEAATKTAATTRQPSPIDEEMPDAPPFSSPAFGYSDGPPSSSPAFGYSDAPPSRMPGVNYSDIPRTTGPARMDGVSYSDIPRTVATSSNAPIRYTAQPVTAMPDAPANARPIYVDEDGDTIFENDRGTQFYLNRNTGRWQYFDDGDNEWHDYRPDDPYGKGKNTRWAATDVTGTHDTAPPITEVPAGLAMLDPDQNENWQAARNYRPRPDEYLVFAHGTPDGVVFQNKLVTPEQLAERITADPRSHGKQIVLISCDTAASDYDVRLAQQPGITAVTAPTQTAWVTPNGRVLSASPDLRQPGNWRHTSGHPPVSHMLPGQDLPAEKEGAVAFGKTKKDLLAEVDGIAKSFTKSYGGGQFGRAVDEFRLRFARDKRAERAAQTLSHLSFKLHDTFRALRDASPNREALPKDLEVQGMLVNDRLVFATNFNATVDLLNGARIPSGDGPPLQRLLSIEQSDARRRAHLTTQDADEYVGRMRRSGEKLDAAFDGARDSATARAMRANERLRIVDAAPSTAEGRQQLRDLLTNPAHRGTTIVLRHADSGADSVHAEQKLMLAVHSAGLDPDDIRGTHVVMGKYRPCLGCWAALNAYRSEGFPVNFNDNYGNYYTESLRSLVSFMPHLAGSVAAQLRSAANQLMSVSALSRQAPPADAYQNNGPEKVIPVHDAPNRGYVTPSDSETEWVEKRRAYVTTKRNLDLATGSRVRTLGVGSDKPFAPRAAQRVLTEGERGDLAAAWKMRDTARATALFKHHAARGVSNQEMSEASGASAGHVGRLVNDKDGHEKRDGREKVHRRVQSRSGRSEAGSTTSKFTKRPDLDTDGQEALRDAMRGSDFYSDWKKLEKGAKGNLQARHIPSDLNRALNQARQRYNIQSIADYVHVARKSLQQHLDKKYGSVNEAAVKREPSPIDEEMPDAPPTDSRWADPREAEFRWADPREAESRWAESRWAESSRAESSRAESSRMAANRFPNVNYSTAPIRYTAQPVTTQAPPANAHPLYTDEHGNTIYVNDRGTQFYLNRTTGRWQYYDESDQQWHDYRPGDPYGKGKGTHWAATDVHGTHETPPPPVRVPAGLALLDDSETANWQIARDHQPRPGEFLVFAHGTPDGIVFQNKIVTPEQLAARINEDPRSHGRRIVLVSCDTAANDYDVRLAQQPGIASVTAPTLTAWTTPSGRILSASPNLQQAGSWRHTSGHPPVSRTLPDYELPTSAHIFAQSDPAADNAVAFGPGTRTMNDVLFDAKVRYVDEARIFEQRLGNYLADRADLNAEVGKVLDKAWQELPRRFRPLVGERDPHLIGSVGGDHAYARNLEVVREGTLRERMTLLWSIARNEALADKLGPIDRHPTIAAERDFRRQYPADRDGIEDHIRTDQTPASVRPPLSSRELAHAVDDQGRLRWRAADKQMHVALTAPLHHDAEQTGGLVRTGTSGSTYLVLSLADRMRTQWGLDVDLPALQLALIAYLVPNEVHSVHEVMAAGQLVDPSLTYDDSWTRYRSLPGLTEDELRTNVAVEGQFPDERAYEELLAQPNRPQTTWSELLAKLDSLDDFFNDVEDAQPDSDEPTHASHIVSDPGAIDGGADTLHSMGDLGGFDRAADTQHSMGDHGGLVTAADSQHSMGDHGGLVTAADSQHRSDDLGGLDGSADVPTTDADLATRLDELDSFFDDTPTTMADLVAKLDSLDDFFFGEEDAAETALKTQAEIDAEFAAQLNDVTTANDSLTNALPATPPARQHPIALFAALGRTEDAMDQAADNVSAARDLVIAAERRHEDTGGRVDPRLRAEAVAQLNAALTNQRAARNTNTTTLNALHTAFGEPLPPPRPAQGRGLGAPTVTQPQRNAAQPTPTTAQPTPTTAQPTLTDAQSDITSAQPEHPTPIIAQSTLADAQSGSESAQHTLTNAQSESAALSPTSTNTQPTSASAQPESANGQLADTDARAELAGVQHATTSAQSGSASVQPVDTDVRAGATGAQPASSDVRTGFDGGRGARTAVSGPRRGAGPRRAAGPGRADSSWRGLDVLATVAEDVEAESAAEAEPVKTPASVRRDLPGYLRESRSLGLAKQLGRTENVDLRTPLGEAGVDNTTVERIQRLAEGGVAPFLGEGRPFAVTVGNRPAELVVRAVFDWYGMTVGDKAAKPNKAETKTTAKDSRTATVKHDGQVEGRVAFAALPPLVADIAGQVPAGATETRTAAHENEFTQKSTVDVDNGLDTKVPVRFVLTLRDARGQIGQRVAQADATVRVPKGLTEPVGPAAPVTTLPALFGVESATGRPAGHRDFFEQVAALLPGEVTAVGAPGRETLKQFLDDATIAAKLPTMVAADGDAHPEAGWVTSDPLLHAPRHGRNRLHKARDGVVQMRLVPRYARVTDSVAEATHTDTQTRSGEDKNTNTAARTVGLTGGVGAGTEAGAVRFAVGPRVGFSRTVEHGQEHTVATSSTETSTVTGPAGRYQVVYDLEVRTIGQPATRLNGTVEGFQWARQDRIDRTGMSTETRNWRGNHGPDRKLFAPAHVEQGRSFGGTIVDDFTTGDRLYEAVSRALRTVPGRHDYHVLSNAFVGQFDDPALTDGLTAGVQAVIARDTKARNALSDRQLAMLLDRIVGPGLEVPLVKNGHLHDYHTVVKVTGEVGALSDGGVVTSGAFGTGSKLKTKTGTQAGRSRTDKAEVSVEGRLYGALSSLFGTLTFGPKITRTGTEAHTLGVTQSGSHTHDHGGTLDEDGSIADQRMVEFLAPLTLSTTSTSYRRLNTSGRRLTLGRPGRDVPRTVEPAALPAQSHRVDVRLLVPEHRVSKTPPPPAPASAPPVSTPIEQPGPVSQLPGGYSRDLDGNRVEAFTAAADLQAAVKEALVTASGDPIFGFPDGVLSSAIADTFSPENLRGDPHVFSRPIVLDGLVHPRRVADVHGRAGVRLRPSNPQVLDGEEYEQAKQSLAGGVVGKQSRGHQWEASASTTGSASIAKSAGGLLMAQFQPFARRWGKARGQELTGNSRLRLTGRPEHRVPVRLDVTAEVVAETRRRGNIDRFDVFSDDSVHRTGSQVRLPGSVVMWMTEAQVHRMREADLDRAHVDRDVALGREQLAEANRLLRDQRDALATLARRQVMERAADPDLLRMHRRAYRELRLTQGRDRLDLRTRHAAAIDALTEGKRRELLDLAAQRPAERADAATGTLPPPPRSLGLGGVSTPIDLTDRIPHLRRRLSEALGEQAAERLLPTSPLRTPHDNARTVHDFLADLDRHLPGALNGGRSQPLRLEDKLSGHTYYLTAQARFPTEPRFAGIEHVEQLGTAGKVVLTTTDTRTSQRTAFGVTGAARLMGLFRGADPAGPGHGPATGTLAAGLRATANLFGRDSKRVETAKVTHKRAASTKGPVATWDGDVEIDLTISRGESFDDTGRGNGTGRGGETGGVVVARDLQVRPVRLHTLAGDTLPEPVPGDDRLGLADPPGALPRAQRTPAARQAWRDAPGHPTLPEAGRFGVEHVLADLGDLRAAAAGAITDSGGAVDASTIAALRDGLSVDNLRTALPAMLGGTFRVPLPGGGDRTLHVDARLVPRPRLAGVDARVELSGSRTHDDETKREQTTGTTYGVGAVLPAAAGGVAHPSGDRPNFGAMSGSSQREQAMFDSAAAQQLKTEVTTGKTSAQQQTSAEVAADSSKLTQTLSYGLELRFVVTSEPTRRAPAGHHSGGTELRVHDAVIIRRAGDDVPPRLKETAEQVAEASKAWTKAVAARDGLRAQGADLTSADTAVAGAERAWWTAIEAHRRAFAGESAGV
ncbi:aldo/keto reductase [Paractinoplanes lichenicola]|uniref:Aldo/keto reductase n=1 Tax=Paractinoplanes lichenicola TaxID=2802976 RepID=A0ABS1VEY3_9ACTN|nr:aldo/keto reductase [Actinoplanes lichenicola]MBL7253233.1 aldo/keto reductase [Actinoplanes lichenicola]